MENKDEPGFSGGEMGRNLSPDRDDSLADFKSPKERHVPSTKVKIINDKKPKKSSSRSKSASSKKRDAAAKNDAQPSIESSFFKAAINARRDGHTCPLCMKYFAETGAGVSHTKTCAARNKVSTKKLLAAVALQEKQAEERMAIGLPAGPVLLPKEKTSRKPRQTGAKGDPDLQLALALSESLQENQLEREFEEALLLASEHRGDGRIVGFSSESERKSTLKNFGFSTNKPAVVSEVRVRRKKHLGPTILQTRSQEARDRILTERIAEILMGNEAITQICQQEISVRVEAVENRQIVLRSRLLKEIHRTTERLWDRADLSAEVTNFYVPDLEPVIMPVVLQKEENPENQENMEKPGEDKKEFPSPEKTPIEEIEKLTSKTSTSSTELREINDEAKYRSESPGLNNINVTDREYRNTLSIDWANTLNVSSISDVVVFVKNGHIWAHKLVFHVRCSDILLECESNEFLHVKETISWPDIDLSTGLAFLEFVYSGAIEKNVKIFTDNHVARGVRSLARKYRLKSLFDYLRKKKNEFIKFNEIEEVSENQKLELRSPVTIEVAETIKNVETFQESSSTNKNIEENLLPLTSEALNETCGEKNYISEQNIAENDLQTQFDSASVISVSSSRSAVSMSPDLFDESTEEAFIDKPKDNEKIELNSNISDDDNTNLKILADLMAEDDLSSASNMSSHSQASTVIAGTIAEKPLVDRTRNFVSFSQGHIETPKSCNNSTSRLIDKPRSQLLPIKQKSNLSLFIEKVQRINAKDALDSIDEGESFEEFAAPKRRRNPFNINEISNDTLLGSTEKIKSKFSRAEKRGLSVFDEPVELKGQSEVSKVTDNTADQNSLLADESSVVDDTVDTDDEDISRYSKYRKNHKYNNSISNYRNKLKELVNVTNDENDDSLSTNEKTDKSHVKKSIDLTQESDSDVDIPPRPLSNASRTSERKSVSDASDGHSIRSASTVIADNSDFNASSDDDNDLPMESVETATSLSTKKIENASKHSNSSTKSPSREESIKAKDQRVNCIADNTGNEIPEYSIDSTPESVKSLTKSPQTSYHDLFDEDNEIFNRSWKSKTESPPLSKSSSSERKRKRTEDRINSPNKDSDTVEEAQYRNKNVTKTLGNSSKFPDLDVFEIDEEIFSNSFERTPVSKEKSLRVSPKSSFDYTDKSASSRRKRRAEEKRAKESSFGNVSTTNNSAKTSDIDVDELFDDFDGDIISRRSLTPELNRSLDSPQKCASSSRKQTKRKSADGEINKSNKFSNGSLKSPEFHYEVFEPDDHPFTQNFNYSPPPPCNTFSPLLMCDFPHEDPVSSLQVSTTIVISSSPENDIDTNKNVCNDQRDCNKENTFAHEQTNMLLSRKSSENRPNSISPTIPLQRSTTPQPGTSKYSNNNCENMPSSGRTSKGLIRWNSMPTTSSSDNVSRKRSRTPKKSSRVTMSQQNVTPPTKYDSMDTPELTKELDKWGMKAQSRNRARKLLNHIYNELHPPHEVAPVENDTENNVESTEDDDEGPARKVCRRDKRTSEDSDSDREIPSSQESATSPVAEEMDFGDDNASSDDLNESASTSSIKKAFLLLIKEDRDIHNQILTYEPLPLELLILMLRARGLKFQTKDLMDFLDEECITFKVQSNQRRRPKRVGGKKIAATQKN